MKRIFLNKLITITIISMILITMVPVSVSAAWIKDYQNNWKYSEGYSNAVGWRVINGLRYYFNSSGIMQTGVVQIDGKIYLLSENGDMQIGNVIIGGNIYYFDNNGVAVGDKLPTPSKGFDLAGNSVRTFTQDQIVNGGGTPIDPNSSAEDNSNYTDYSVTFLDNNGDKLKSRNIKKDEYVTLYKPSKSGYTFIEWNTKKNGNGTSYDYDEKIKVQDDITLYAQWEDNSEGSGGSNDSGSSSNKVFVTDISVYGKDNVNKITTKAGTLQMATNVLPIDATNKKVTWSVENITGKATISSDGLVTAVSNGSIIVKATANDGSEIKAIETITITGQSSEGGLPGSGDSGSNDETTITSNLEDYTVNGMDTTTVNGTASNPKLYKTLSILRSDITLENVNATTLAIQGGKKITLKNCNIKNLKLNDSDGTFEIIIDDSSKIETMNLYKGAIITSTIGKINTVNIDTTDVVSINAPVSTVKITTVAKVKIGDSTSIDKIEVGSNSKGTIIAGKGTITEFKSNSTIDIAVGNIITNNSIIQNSSDIAGYIALINGASNIEVATLAVERAEKSNLGNDLDQAFKDFSYAKVLVNSLSDSDKKNKLQSRLDKIVKDNSEVEQIRIALQEVKETERLMKLSNGSENSLEIVNDQLIIARQEVKKLSNGSADRINLTKTLDVIDKSINQGKNLNIIIKAIANSDFTDVTDYKIFEIAGINSVTSNNFDGILEKLKALYKPEEVKNADDVQMAVSNAIREIELEGKIKDAKAVAISTINVAKAEVNNLFGSGGIINSNVGKTAISIAKDKVTNARDKIDKVKALGVKAESDVIELENEYKPVNEAFISAVKQLTTKEVNNLFADENKNKLQDGISANDINLAEGSVNELIALIKGTSDTDALALKDNIEKARVLLEKRKSVAKKTWNSIELDTINSPALYNNVDKSIKEDDYRINISLPNSIGSSYVKTEDGKLYLGSDKNNLSNTFIYDDANTTASVGLNGSGINIKVPVAFNNATSGNQANWIYNVACLGNQLSINPWTESITVSDNGISYTFKFVMTHKISKINTVNYDVFTITMIQ